MRKIVVIACLFIATAAFAQQNKPNGFYVFVTNPGGGYSTNEQSWQGAFGVALQHMFAPRFSGEISVSRDVQYTHVRIFNPDFTVASSYTLTTRTTPVDVTGRYHFLNDSHWKPYIGADARYVDSRMFLGVTGGVVWQFRQSLGLRFDAKVLVSDRPQHNERLYNSVGLSWRF